MGARPAFANRSGRVETAMPESFRRLQQSPNYECASGVGGHRRLVLLVRPRGRIVGTGARGLRMRGVGDPDRLPPLEPDVLEELLAEPAEPLLMRRALEPAHELTETGILGRRLLVLVVRDRIVDVLVVALPGDARTLLQREDVRGELLEVGELHVEVGGDAAAELRRQDLHPEPELVGLGLAVAQELYELVRLAAIELSAPGVASLLLLLDLHRLITEEVHRLLERRVPVRDVAHATARATSILEVMVPRVCLESREALEAADVRDRRDEARSDEGSAARDGLEDFGKDLVRLERLALAVEAPAREHLFDVLLLRLEAPEDRGLELVALEKCVHELGDCLLVGARREPPALKLLADQGEEVLALGVRDLAAEDVLDELLKDETVNLLLERVGLDLARESKLDERLVAVGGEQSLVGPHRRLVRTLVRAPAELEPQDRDVLRLDGIESLGRDGVQAKERVGARLARRQLLAGLLVSRLLLAEAVAASRDDLVAAALVQEEARVAEDLRPVGEAGKREPVGRSAHL